MKITISTLIFCVLLTIVLLYPGLIVGEEQAGFMDKTEEDEISRLAHLGEKHYLWETLTAGLVSIPHRATQSAAIPASTGAGVGLGVSSLTGAQAAETSQQKEK